MNPFPVAHTTWNEGRFKIYNSRPIDTDKHGQPAKSLTKQKSLVVATGSGALEL